MNRIQFDFVSEARSDEVHRAILNEALPALLGQVVYLPRDASGDERFVYDVEHAEHAIDWLIGAGILNPRIDTATLAWRNGEPDYTWMKKAPPNYLRERISAIQWCLFNGGAGRETELLAEMAAAETALQGRDL